MLSDSELYDRRYSDGAYRSSLCGYEFARWSALQHFVVRVAKQATARRVIDYGAGRGLFAPLWREVFPQAELLFCDVSSVALAQLEANYPQHAGRTALVQENRADLPDASADVVISVEVLEHVTDLGAYLEDVRRLLRPGGTFIWTTPCRNALSIEHVVAFSTGRIDRTGDGAYRWRWEDPTHLRRLTTREAKQALRKAGFDVVRFRLRSHFFSYFVTEVLPTLRPYKVRAVLERYQRKLLDADYAYFRLLPNGASMIGLATKPR